MARRNRLPVVTIVHNNAACGIIRAGQRAQLEFELGTALDGTDYAAVARAAIRFACGDRLRDGVCPASNLKAFGRMNAYGFDALTS